MNRPTRQLRFASLGMTLGPSGNSSKTRNACVQDRYNACIEESLAASPKGYNVANLTKALPDSFHLPSVLQVNAATRNHPMKLLGVLLGAALAMLPIGAGLHAQPQQPNIIVIMGDDIGWANIGVYNQGVMSGRTPNLDRLANEGMRFTDYYAEASCTAGRANFITGELPIRTGLTTVGQAGSPLGIPDAGGDHRPGAQVDGLRHRPVRQEPSRRSQQVPADRARLRRVLRLPLPPGRDGGPVASELPAGAEGRGRPAQHGPFLGHRSRRSHRAAALGQDRQAADRGCRHALSQADGDGRRRNPRQHAEVHRQGARRQEAVLRLAQPDAHARRHASVRKV